MATNHFNSLTPTLLMGPGPSCVPDQVYTALSQYTIGHLDPRFIAIMDEIKNRLQTLMQTDNKLTIPISGTGSSGMETCFVNLIEPGDPVLILKNGVFGMRMEDLATRLGADVDVLEFEWGTPVLLKQVKTQLQQKQYAIVAVVHAETSTGVMNPVAEIGDLLKGNEALYLVDSVTSLGGIPVETDNWGIDALYSGTQKCLSCPPGLAPVSFSPRAMEVATIRKTKVQSWYLDVNFLASYWGSERVYHHTAPITMNYALHEALRLVLEEGLEARWARHQQAHETLKAGLARLGLSITSQEGHQLWQLNAVGVPDGADEAGVRGRLLNEFGIEVGPGLGPMKGKIWRVGLMGHNATEANVERFLNALGQCLA